FFGSAEAQVISVTFNQIIVMSPPGRDTTPDGSGTVTGPVDIKVVNVNSNTNTSFTGGFRYTPKMQITTVGPTEGPFTGGTRVRIDGIGFDDPVGVVIGGVAAQVISVSGTEIVAITSPVNLNSCGDVTGPIVVGNTNNGDTATGPDFIYRVPKPLIVNISNPNNLGGTATITVFNALGFPRITIGGVSVSVTATVVNPDGTTTFTVQLPPTIKLQTTSCPAGGTAQIPTAFDVAYTSATTGCTDTSPSGITVLPPATPLLFLNPPTFQPFTATITPNVAPAPPFPGTSVTPSATQTVNIVNNGSAPLTITGITDNGAPACARFSPLPPPATFPLNLNQCEAFPLIEQYFGQTTQGSETCTITISTNAGNKTLLLVGTSQ
ncbi:MAG TPA: IPT/TIG domain-containing protein, partial [Thermoanaerobaculia bacterium]|nr:IPT/TIG domain-containing protein [Thermoanaerobaculia bacterium]